MKKLAFLALILVTSPSNKDLATLNQLVDNWHLAATNADFSSYFGAMDESFIFLGTAPGERWTKTQFATFSKPYFDKGRAWDFKPSNRTWEFSRNGKVAWFDEDLDTWMLGCRGAGVYEKIRGKWSLKYYNLTVLIENDKVDSFIELRKED